MKLQLRTKKNRGGVVALAVAIALSILLSSSVLQRTSAVAQIATATKAQRQTKSTRKLEVRVAGDDADADLLPSDGPSMVPSAQPSSDVPAQDDSAETTTIDAGVGRWRAAVSGGAGGRELEVRGGGATATLTASDPPSGAPSTQPSTSVPVDVESITTTTIDAGVNRWRAAVTAAEGEGGARNRRRKRNRRNLAMDNTKSQSPSDAPSLVPSDVPSDVPSMVPSGVGPDDEDSSITVVDGDEYVTLDTVTLSSSGTDVMDADAVSAFESVCANEFLPTYMQFVHPATYTDVQCHVISQSMLDPGAQDGGARRLEEAGEGAQRQNGVIEMKTGSVAILMEATSNVNPPAEDFGRALATTIETYSTEFQQLLSEETEYFDRPYVAAGDAEVAAAAAPIENSSDDAAFPTLVVVVAAVGGAVLAIALLSIANGRRRNHNGSATAGHAQQKATIVGDNGDSPMKILGISPPSSPTRSMKYQPLESASVSTTTGPKQVDSHAGAASAGADGRYSLVVENKGSDSLVDDGKDEEADNGPRSPCSWCSTAAEIDDKYIPVQLQSAPVPVVQKRSMVREPSEFSTGVCSVESEFYNDKEDSQQQQQQQRSNSTTPQPSEDGSENLRGLRLLKTGTRDSSTATSKHGSGTLYGWSKRLLGFGSGSGRSKEGEEDEDIIANQKSPRSLEEDRQIPESKSSDSDDSSVDLVKTTILSLAPTIESNAEAGGAGNGGGPSSPPHKGKYIRTPGGGKKYLQAMDASACCDSVAGGDVSVNTQSVLSDLGELEQERGRQLQSQPDGASRTPKAENRGKFHKAPHKVLYDQYGF